MTPIEKYIEGAAYHEAAHIVIAAVQGLRLRRAGLRINENGAGEASYKSKKPDGSRDLGPDSFGEGSIIATMAGQIAHGKIYSPVADGDANACADLDFVQSLLAEMYSNREDRSIAQKALFERSRALVSQHWPAIECIGRALWAKPWSGDAPREKRIDGEELLALLAQQEIEAAFEEA